MYLEVSERVIVYFISGHPGLFLSVTFPRSRCNLALSGSDPDIRTLIMAS